MNLYTIVTNDRYELPVICDLRVKEAAEFLGTTTNNVRLMVCKPPKKSVYKVIITGKVEVDRRIYEKRYRIAHDRSEYFRERWKRTRMEREMMQMEELYKQSQEFRAYVDKYCNSYGFTVQETLGHALVREAADYYRRGEDKKGEKEKTGAGKVIAGDLGNGIPV